MKTSPIGIRTIFFTLILGMLNCYALLGLSADINILFDDEFIFITDNVELKVSCSQLYLLNKENLRLN